MHRYSAFLLLPLVFVGCSRPSAKVAEKQPDVTPIYAAPIGFAEYQRLKLGVHQPAGLPEALQAVHARFCEIGHERGWDEADRWRFDQLADLSADDVVAQWAPPPSRSAPESTTSLVGANR